MSNLIKVFSKSEKYGHRDVTQTVLDKLIESNKVNIIQTKHGSNVYVFKEQYKPLN